MAAPRKVSAGAVIFRKTRKDPEYLLLHYPAGHWEFVKGTIEPGETEEETLRREIEEETGIAQIRLVPGFRKRIDYFYREKGRLVFKTVIFYLVETRRKKVELSYEHVGYAWLPYRKAYRQLTFANSRKVLQSAERKRKEQERKEEQQSGGLL